MHVIAAKAVAFGEAAQPEFSAYSQAVIDNATAMVERLLHRGFDLVSGGTDNHLMLIDLSDRDISGKDGEEILGRARITVNKNTVPGERRSPYVTSGIRIGTPAMTTRGLGVSQSARVADCIADALDNPHDESVILKVRSEIADLCAQFPIYPESSV